MVLLDRTLIDSLVIVVLVIAKYTIVSVAWVPAGVCVTNLVYSIYYDDVVEQKRIPLGLCNLEYSLYISICPFRVVNYRLS